jgi:glycosyltransferase involved in cell wall biosynthesis
MLQALRRAGASPRLLSLDRGEFWEERMQSLGVRVLHAGHSGSRLKRLFRVMGLLRKDRPDVVQSQHFFANAYAGIAARMLRAAGIGALRNDGVSEENSSGAWGGWLNLHCPRMIAANSQVAIQYASGRGLPASRLHFLPNVVDTDWFQPAGPGATPNQHVTLVAVGRLVRQKRLDRFLWILSRLHSEYHLDVRGLVVGPGCRDEDLRQDLARLAARLGLLPDLVQFRGGVSDTRPVYHESAVCVLTSDHEGTPNVLLEAMASGLPVVASGVGGVPDIVRDGQTGFLVAPDDVSGFAAALAGLVKNPWLRKEMGASARAFVEEHHSLHRLPNYLVGLYQRALAGRRRFQTAAPAKIPMPTESHTARRA